MPMGLSTGVISDSQIKASEHLSKQQHHNLWLGMPTLCRIQLMEPGVTT